MSDHESVEDTEWAPPPPASPTDHQDEPESQQSLEDYGAATETGRREEQPAADAVSRQVPAEATDGAEETASLTDFDDADGPRSRAELAESLVHRLADVDDAALEMLRLYSRQGIGEPIDIHDAVGVEDDRRIAYARNRQLRLAGVIEHVGRGRYRYRLPELVAEAAEADADADAEADADLSIEDRAEVVSTIEAELGLGEADG